MQKASMPTPVHTDPSRAARACVTWYIVTWDPEKSPCCGWLRFFSNLFSQKKTLTVPTPCCHVRGDGMTQGPQCHICCACWVYVTGAEVKGNKVKAPGAARMGPVSRRVQPPVSMGGCLEALWSGCSGGACWAVEARQLRKHGTRTMPFLIPQALSHCRALSRPQELYGRRLSACSLCQCAVSTAWISCRTLGLSPHGLAHRPQLPVAPPHFRGPNDLHSRRTSGEAASLYWSSNQEKVTKNERRPCPAAWLQVFLPVTFRVGTDPTPSPWDLEAPGTWSFSSVSHQHRNS